MVDLSIIIVSWNCRERLAANLRRLQSSEFAGSLEIFVVDNASADDTAAMVAELFPDVKLIANSANLGFAKANNQALKLAQGRYLLLLNPDMLVFPDTLQNLVAWLDRQPQAAVTGVKLLDEQGGLVKHVRRFPRLLDQLAVASKLAHLWPSLLKAYLRQDFDYDRSQPVDSVRGSFFALRRETFERLGGLDERYFIWFEEVDYCRQAKQAGLEVWYSAEVACVDFVGQSFKLVQRGLTQRYFRNSMLAYFDKWHGRWPALCLRAAWFVGNITWRLAASLGLKPRAKT